MTDSRDELFMARAVELARRGIGRVEPNPPVGAVLVRGEKIVGEGWHRAFGGPHAEVEAFREAGEAARGASLYVTLEPCCHQGKTPPCTEAIREADVAEVVYAVRDPFPAVAGKGVETLQAFGLEVRAAFDGSAARELLAPYFRWTVEGLPWIVAKWAMTLDGKIASRSGDSRWVSSEASRQRAQRARDSNLTILVGVGTALADDPLLTCRIEGGRQPLRVVADSRCRLPIASRLVRTAREAPLLVATTPGAPPANVRTLEDEGVEVAILPATQDGKVDLVALCRELVRRRAVTVLAEGGGKLLGALFDRSLVSEVEVYIAPRIVGGREAPGPVAGLGVQRMADALDLDAVSTFRTGEDLMITGRVQRRAAD
ncbi:MAG: bifunctional diaminohydroxyphosphoribosylaminopyrimidine deaminase/5-amino-6-(5-phosphoribosylamino)uracil reductase RibD [Planctomycetes bacterium]|nr:bifunctional diaminohydroxyphosphoribosylaminopyrimidine deaminase/5-amino-6-(5-phosphoribosylamino)uracil reductase RibD [Planctomycetota bacterium]